jgi:hypothetical protein
MATNTGPGTGGGGTGTPQNIVHGARAQLNVTLPDGTSKIMGIFTNVSWGVNYDVSPAWVLGRFSPAALTYTGQDVVTVNASGYRVYDNGAFVSCGLPTLDKLLTYTDMSLSIQDRQPHAGRSQNLVIVTNVKPTGYNAGVAARALSEMSVTFQGLIAADENVTNAESPDATPPL